MSAKRTGVFLQFLSPLEKLVDRSYLIDIDNTDFRLPNLGRHYGRARWTDVRGNLDVIQLHIRTSVLGGDRCQKEGTFDLTHSVTGVRL